MAGAFEHLRLSVIVLAELEYGASKVQERAELRHRVDYLAGLVQVIEFTRADAAYYGKIRAHLANLKPNAAVIGQRDLMIAAQSLRIGACVITNNRREFDRVPGLQVEDWQTA